MLTIMVFGIGFCVGRIIRLTLDGIKVKRDKVALA